MELNDDILLSVMKPARYIGEEWNVSRKDFDKADIRFALCFPDLYEVGMSNLGIRILYGILNAIPDVCCERFFSCSQDMQAKLRTNHVEIFSLESKRSLREFDLVGFSLGYELDYTNVLDILDLGGIPLQAALRDSSYPLIIGGGPCTMNPEPVSEFFDIFVIGEAEEVILEVIDAYRKVKDTMKSGRLNRQDLLVMLSGIEGVYVPSLYEVEYAAGGAVQSFRPKAEGVPSTIKKRFIRDLNTAYFPSEWLTPYIQIIHDRITLEIMRGCPNRCKFCQARQQYYPFRVRAVNQVLQHARESFCRSGYEEISLAGLSVSDYPDIENLLKQLIGFFKTKGIGVSLPSIKPRDMVGDLSSLIATIKKTGLTFAPEAATEKLRKAINKDFDAQDFFRAIEEAYRSGYQHVKLYFMIGLPFEEQEDLDAILDFGMQVAQLRRTVLFRDKPCGPAQVNISVNTLIPKPHTPCQWLAMEDMDAVLQKQRYLKSKVKSKKLKLNFHNPSMSFLEGVLSRGDRRLSKVILGAFKRGARFDAWGDYFVFDTWIAAFKESGIDAGFYLRQRPKDEFLPWNFIDVGVDKQSLIADAP